jgi:hypothetical protein
VAFPSPRVSTASVTVAAAGGESSREGPCTSGSTRRAGYPTPIGTRPYRPFMWLNGHTTNSARPTINDLGIGPKNLLSSESVRLSPIT